MESAHAPVAMAEAMLLGGRYRLGARLGAGAGGVVFVATDERLGREVALKVVQTAITDGRAFDRLVREAHAAARTGHPNIVQILDLGRTDDGHPFIVMERLRGETLDERVHRLGKLDVALARDIHVQLLDALAAAHGAGVLHRDVKPSNVFLTELVNGRVLVKLVDFGLAALLDAAGAKLSDTGSVLGSPAYLAPERWLGRVADARTDVYAVGVCLYESLVGRPPFEAPSVTALRGRVVATPAPSLTDARGDVDADIADVVRRALAKDPDERFETAAAMRDALLGKAPIAAPQRARRRGRRVPMVAAAGIVALLALVAIYFATHPAAQPVAHASSVTAPTRTASPPHTPTAAPSLAVASPAPTTAPPATSAPAPPAHALAAPPPSAGQAPHRIRPPPPPAPPSDAPPAGHNPRVGESILDPF